METGIRFTAAHADAVHAAMRASGVDADDVLRWPGGPNHTDVTSPWS